MPGASMVSAYSLIPASGNVEAGERRTRNITGWSAGLTLLYQGGSGICGGNWRAALLIIACTSCAAASILRLRSNCKMIDELPRELVELIELTPAIVENCFSSGRATADAIVSGLAPGRLAPT